MAVTIPTCLCPADSPLTALAKINNNLSALFFLMSAGSFRGDTVNLGACLCSELQILATLNNNISRFFTWVAANGGAPVDPSISSWAQLAAIPTVGDAAGSIKIWVESATGILRATQLLVGSDATDTASGIQRPDDWASSGLVWYNKLA